jgi:hypothetical protein
MTMIARSSTCALLLKSGVIQLYSNRVGDVIDEYNKNFETGEGKISGNGMITVNLPKINELKSIVNFNGSLLFDINFTINCKIDYVFVKVLIWNAEQRPIVDFLDENLMPFKIDSPFKNMTLKVKLKDLKLNSGKHFISLHFFDPNDNVICRVDNYLHFTMEYHVTTNAGKFANC